MCWAEGGWTVAPYGGSPNVKDALGSGEELKDCMCHWGCVPTNNRFLSAFMASGTWGGWAVVGDMITSFSSPCHRGDLVWVHGSKAQPYSGGEECVRAGGQWCRAHGQGFQRSVQVQNISGVWESNQDLFIDVQWEPRCIQPAGGKQSSERDGLSLAGQGSL